MPSSFPIVDIHTHVYPPSYISLLQSRTTIPYIRTFGENHRLVILPSEEASSHGSPEKIGRPIGPEYHSISHKISFMDAHKIQTSVISLANPWLDWLPPTTAAATAASINEEVNDLCAEYPKRLYFFGTLPLSASPTEILFSIAQLHLLPYCRGVILGTTGLGSGLDDPNLLPIFAALANASLPIFLHPHYGLPAEVWGPRAEEYGHVLPLALGFPLETTVAIARMVLSGAFERADTEKLEVILAHSGGTLPFLAGRIESCIAHDGLLHSQAKAHPEKKRKTLWEILKTNIYLDAVIYNKVGLGAAVEASGADRIMFGTDHPFFPPLEGGEEWESVVSNVAAVEGVFGKETEETRMAMGGNAVRVLKLDV